MQQKLYILLCVHACACACVVDMCEYAIYGLVVCEFVFILIEEIIKILAKIISQKQKEEQNLTGLKGLLHV